MPDATNQIDNQIDGKMFNYDGTKLYSIIAGREFSVQGRMLPFETSDAVPLGIKTPESGKYIISLAGYDGIFLEGQKIYLKDNKLNLTHCLSESDYAFESESGIFDKRFEIVYEEETIMGTDDLTSNSIQIYKDRNYIVVDSKTAKILTVEFHDLNGRNLYRDEKLNTNYYRVKIASQGVLIVRAQTENGEIQTRKLINK